MIISRTLLGNWKKYSRVSLVFIIFKVEWKDANHCGIFMICSEESLPLTELKYISQC